jgi:ABC-type branched-subunit amino acid transport system permease subunit
MMRIIDKGVGPLGEVKNTPTREQRGIVFLVIASDFFLITPILSAHRVTDSVGFCIFAMSFDFLYGYLGRLSFGHMLFLGTSAYSGRFGRVLYAQISSVHRYMGLSVLLLSFAMVIVGGMWNLNGSFLSAFAPGMVMSITPRYWSQGTETQWCLSSWPFH